MSGLTVQVIRQYMAPIKELLDDAQVTDILIYGPDEVHVRRTGKGYERTDICWPDADDLLAAVRAIGRIVKRNINADQPILDSRLPDGSRVNAIISPCFERGACVSIRLFPKKRFSGDDLVNGGSLDAEGLAILRAIVAAGRNILVSGGTGSGKTTLLNVLAGMIRSDQVIVTVEDSREIQIPGENRIWAALEAKHVVRIEDTPVGLRELVKNALRMNPTWLIVGEVRGDEAVDLLRAFNTGHCGAGTIHANSAFDALLALENLVRMGGRDVGALALKEQVARAIHIVVQVNQFPDESRKVVEIMEVEGLDYDVSPAHPPYRLRPLYRFMHEGFSREGQVTGNFCVEEHPTWIEELKMVPDVPMPAAWRD